MRVIVKFNTIMTMLINSVKNVITLVKLALVLLLALIVMQLNKEMLLMD